MREHSYAAVACDVMRSQLLNLLFVRENDYKIDLIKLLYWLFRMGCAHILWLVDVDCVFIVFTFLRLTYRPIDSL